jgi:hypothetical protein
MKPAKYQPTPSHEEIGARSRQLWQLSGNPAGRDLEFWLAAEVEVYREREETRTAIEKDSQNQPPKMERIRR